MNPPSSQTVDILFKCNSFLTFVSLSIIDFWAKSSQTWFSNTTTSCSTTLFVMTYWNCETVSVVLSHDVCDNLSRSNRKLTYRGLMCSVLIKKQTSSDYLSRQFQSSGSTFWRQWNVRKFAVKLHGNEEYFIVSGCLDIPTVNDTEQKFV